jgi:uncharacterized membrane protein YccC
MIGTLVGAVVIVVLTGRFPQDRAAFLVALALWGAICAPLATLLRNFAFYAPALAGYTSAIIAAGTLGATGAQTGSCSCSLSHAPSRVALASYAPASFSR